MAGAASLRVTCETAANDLEAIIRLAGELGGGKEKSPSVAAERAPMRSETTLPNATIPHTHDERQRQALYYASKLGIAVFPLHSIRPDGCCTCGAAECRSPGKHPLTPRGVHDATTDPTIIRDWWHRWPFANIGGATGRVSGFFVVDLDGQLGQDWLADMEAAHGQLPDTVKTLTGGGGRHVFFRYPDFPVKNSTSTIAPGVDVRGDGGYVVLPRSVHVSGHHYEWDASSRPDRVPIAPAPAWMLALLRGDGKNAGKATPVSEWRELAQGVSEGARNNAVARVAGHLLRRSVNPTLTLHLLLAWNRFYCSPPLADDEVARTVNSIAAAELRRRAGGARRGA